MNCDEVKKYLSEYIDGELPPETSSKFSEHIKVCPDCEKEYFQLKKTVECLHGLDELDAPPNIIVNVNKVLDSETLFQKLLGIITGLVPHRVPYKTIAAVVTIIIVAYLSYKSPPTMKRLEKTASEIKRQKTDKMDTVLKEHAVSEEEVSVDFEEAVETKEEVIKPKVSEPVGETKILEEKVKPKKKRLLEKKAKLKKLPAKKEVLDDKISDMPTMFDDSLIKKRKDENLAIKEDITAKGETKEISPRDSRIKNTHEEVIKSKKEIKELEQKKEPDLDLVLGEEKPPVSEAVPAAPKPKPQTKVPAIKEEPKRSLQYNLPADKEEGLETLSFGEDETREGDEYFAGDYDERGTGAKVPQLSTEPIDIMPEEQAYVLVKEKEAVKPPSTPVEEPVLEYEPIPNEKAAPVYDDSADVLVEGGARGWEEEAHKFEPAEEMMEEEESEPAAPSGAQSKVFKTQEEAAEPSMAGKDMRDRESKRYVKEKSMQTVSLEKAQKIFLNYYKLKVKDIGNAREYIIDAAKSNDAFILEDEGLDNAKDDLKSLPKQDSMISIKIMIPMANYDKFIEMINNNIGFEIVKKEVKDIKLNQELSDKRNEISKNRDIKLLIVDIELTL